MRWRLVRHDLLMGIIWTFVGLAATRVVATTYPEGYKPPPNIVFILTDDMRWDAMGCVGNRVIKTPSLDRLAEEGVVFRNMFCTTSICATSRASFLTGQYAARHGIGNFGTSLAPEQFAETFPAILRQAGYRTGFVGKWGLGGPLPREEFDFFAGFSGQGSYFEKDDPKHLTSKLGEQVIRFLEESDGSQPFLLCLSTKAPHCKDGAPRQFQPDPRYEAMYKDVTIPPIPTATNELFEALPEFTRVSEGRTRWTRRFSTPEQFQASVRDYYALITGVDAVVGQIMARLREKGEWDNTVIVFTSDNGFFLGERGLAGKWLMYEESIRLPLIIRYPGLCCGSDGRRVDEMVLSIDIAPTILQAAVARIPERMQGRSLVPLLSKTATAWRKDWFYEHHFDYKGRIPRTEGVRSEEWKYTRYLDSDPPYEELFDLKRDPQELRNLAGDKTRAAKLKEMRKRWKILAAESK